MGWYKRIKMNKAKKEAKSLHKEADAPLCPKCQSPMSLKKGPYGDFYGCSQYPRCKGTAKINGQQPIVPIQQPQRQQVPAQQRQNIPAAPFPAKINNPWVLATLLKDGTPIVARKGEGDFWEYLDEKKSGHTEYDIDMDGASGEIPVKSLATTIKSVVDKDNKKITGNDPEALFKIFREMNGIADPDEIPEAVIDEGAPKIKGRIPEDKISPYQKQIETSFNNTKSNIMINALAGTGKTTALKHIASFMNPGERWLYIVFNTKNKNESQGKFPPGVTVMTSHGFLGQVLGTNGEDHKTLPNTKYIFQDKNIANKKAKKIDLILDDVMSDGGETEIPQNLRFLGSSIVKKVVSLCKAYSVNPLVGNPTEKIIDIIRSYEINTKILDPDKQGAGWNGDPIPLQDYTEEIAATSLRVLKYSIPGMCNKPELNYVRDFDDTLWFPAINPNIVWPRYDVVLADEVQDFNECQSVMLKKLSDAGARVVAVGDPNQSIYRFRGSDSKSFEKVSQSIQAAPNGGVVHELPTNYRSGKKIIEYVRTNTHVKDLQAGLNFDGDVTEGSPKEEAIESVINEVKQGGKLKMSTAVIARTNSPLAKTAIELMKNNIEFLIIGKDFSKELTDFIYKTTKEAKRNRFDNNYLSNLGIQRLLGVMSSFTSKYVDINGKKPSKIEEIKENSSMIELMTSVIEFLEQEGYQDKKANKRVNTAQDFIQYLKNKFSGINEEEEDPFAGKDPLSFVTLTSAHKSKGLEFDRVFIIEPNLFPHPKAKSTEDIEQESNAKYVAFTRAMKELHVLAPSVEKNQERGEERGRGGRRRASSTKKTKTSKKNKGWYKKAILNQEPISSTNTENIDSQEQEISSKIMNIHSNITGLNTLMQKTADESEKNRILLDIEVLRNEILQLSTRYNDLRNSHVV